MCYTVMGKKYGPSAEDGRLVREGSDDEELEVHEDNRGQRIYFAAKGRDTRIQ